MNKSAPPSAFDMEIVRLLGMAVTGALTAVVLRRGKTEFAALAALTAAAACLTAVVLSLTPAVTLLRSLADAVPDGEESMTCLMKATGTALLASLASDICLDCGEQALARTCLWAGRASVLLVSLPIFTELAETAFKLMKV